MMKPLISLIFLVLSQTAWAWPPTFGPEFNFTNEAIREAGREAGIYTVDSSANKAARDEFRKAALGKCPLCTSETVKDGYGIKNYVVTHPDGWNFTISLDPWVVEVKMGPMTADQIESAEPEIQRMIFDTATEIGMHPPDRAGHVHIGLDSGFDMDPLLFRNFLGDWIEHSKMAYELFGANTLNAPTVDMLGKEPHENLIKIFAEFDRLLLKILDIKEEQPSKLRRMWTQVKRAFGVTPKVEPPPAPGLFDGVRDSYEIYALVKEIRKQVYATTVYKEHDIPEKFQSANLEHIHGNFESDTLELRSVHEVQNAREYTNLVRLLEGRLEYMKKFDRPLPFKGVRPTGRIRTAIEMFAEYGKRAGRSWNEIKDMVIREHSDYEPSKPYVKPFEKCAGAFDGI